jgi:hypothetical protein
VSHTFQHELDASVGQAQPVGGFIGFAGFQRLRVGGLDRGTIFRVDGIQESLERGKGTLLGNFKNPISFIGPEELVGQRIAFPAAKVRHTLSFIETGLAFPHRRLRTPALGDFNANANQERLALDEYLTARHQHPLEGRPTAQQNSGFDGLVCAIA